MLYLQIVAGVCVLELTTGITLIEDITRFFSFGALFIWKRDNKFLTMFVSKFVISELITYQKKIQPGIYCKKIAAWKVCTIRETSKEIPSQRIHDWKPMEIAQLR